MSQTTNQLTMFIINGVKNGALIFSWEGRCRDKKRYVSSTCTFWVLGAVSTTLKQTPNTHVFKQIKAWIRIELAKGKNMSLSKNVCCIFCRLCTQNGWSLLAGYGLQGRSPLGMLTWEGSKPQMQAQSDLQVTSHTKMVSLKVNCACGAFVYWQCYLPKKTEPIFFLTASEYRSPFVCDNN